MRQFLTQLLLASEKAALIARACRKEKDLFALLIEEKTGSEKNQKFSHDFKTLADVLIQETVRYDLGKTYPVLAANIRGEESNKFTNTLGETICVQVCGTQQETSDLLSQVLDGHKVAADLLAREVHSDTSKLAAQVQEDVEKVPDIDLNIEDVGIWIDPIDSTNNYIRGTRDHDLDVKGDQVLVSKGLRVVTVLIGVFNRQSGRPIIGVVNQPFAEYNSATDSWRGQVYWGISYENLRIPSSSLLTQQSSSEGDQRKKIVVSFTESDRLQSKLQERYELFEAAGAGYKILSVAKGWVDLYVTQKPSSYKWDTCAGHAILLSLGGGCVDFRKSERIIPGQEEDIELQYNSPLELEGIEKWSNSGGLIAYRNKEDRNRVLELIWLPQSEARVKN